MLSRRRNVFRVADLRNKVLFTLFMIAVYRLGSHLPLPFVDFSAIHALKDRAAQGGALAFLDLFSGGAMTSVAVFVLGVMPYVTSSIIMQLLTMVIPKLDQWRQEGQAGQKKITRWTRYLTVALALMQSTGIAGIDLIRHFGVAQVLLIVGTLTAGAVMIMWLGELITERGIGNGMSLLIFASVVSGLPAQGSAIWAAGNYLKFATVVAMGVGLIVGIVFVDQTQRRVPVQFAPRVESRRMSGGQSTYIALNLYPAIAFKPQQQADLIRRLGGFIPGIRPGPPTERYLQQVVNRITLPGSIFLMVMAVIPLLVFAALNIQQLPFGGTALLITVGVALVTTKQIDSQLMMRNYEGFLR